MNQYLLSVYQPGEAPSDPALLDEVRSNLAVLNKELDDAGARVISVGLGWPTAAKVVRSRPGDTPVTDGPFAETKEFLGGFTIIGAADEDEAVVWGRKMSEATTLPIEVRPLAGEATL